MTSGILGAIARVRKGESVESLVRDKIDRIADDPYNCFITVLKSRALRMAKKMDERIRNGEHLPLAGVTVAVKDNIMVEDAPLTCGSKILANYRAPYSATVVSRMESRGAVIIGKTNMDEFGMGSTSENSASGFVRNPACPTRVAGGSSGGSAAAVAAGFADVALGSDSGGSIRLPASFCGVCGLKPTYGSVSRYGLVAYVSSMDQIGPIAGSVEDLRTLYSVIAGPDARDATCREDERSRDTSNNSHLNSLDGIRIAFFDYRAESHPDICAVMDHSRRLMEEAGAIVRDVRLPFLDVLLPVYYIIACAEASSNLARYDGIQFGTRSVGKTGPLPTDQVRTALLGREVKRRILLGTYALSRGGYQAYYKQAVLLRSRIRRSVQRILKDCHCIAGPVSPVLAGFPGCGNDPLDEYANDAFTVPANLCGLPAMSLPAGVSRDQRPVGLQLIAGENRENLLLNIARQLEMHHQ